MPKLKNLSGENVLKILQSFGFVVVSQKGSHLKLRRVIGEIKQTLTIPLHNGLDKGTLKAIYNQTLRYIPESDLSENFYG